MFRTDHLDHLDRQELDPDRADLIDGNS